MENPSSRPSSEPVLKRIPLAQIRPSRQNPRKVIRQEMIDGRSDSMKESGQANPIQVRPLTPEEIAQEPDKNIGYEIIDGEIRYWAALKNGDRDINSYIVECTLEEAFERAVLANRAQGPSWFEDYLAMETRRAFNPVKITNRKIAALFEMDPAMVTRAFRILSVLSAKNRYILLENFKLSAGNWKIAENTLLRLADLGDAEKVDLALPVVLDKEMTEPQAKALVGHILAGKPIGDFDPEAKPTRQASKPTPAKPVEVERLAGKPMPGNGVGSHPGPVPTPALEADTSGESALPQQGSDNGPSWVLKALAGISPLKAIRAKVQKNEKLVVWEKLFLVAYDLWEGVLKLWKNSRPLRHGFLKVLHNIGKIAANTIAPIRHSHSSGSKVSGSRSNPNLETVLEVLAHWTVYGLCQLVFWEFMLGWIPFLKPWLEWLPRLVVHEGLVVFPAWALAYGKANLFPAIIVVFLVIFGLAYAAAKNLMPVLFLLGFLGLTWYYGRNWSEIPPPWRTSAARSQIEGQALSAPIPKQGIGDPVAVIPPPQVQAKNQHPHLIEKTNEVPAAAPVAQVSISNAFDGDEEEKALLQTAIAALPMNCIIKPYLVEPDASIGQLMAVNRLGDLAVESEYSLRVGQGGQKITSLTPSATGVVIVTEGGLPLGSFLGGGSTFGFYWEDVLTIYCDELDVKENGKTKIIYQCSITATNLNQPLVVQCYTANNLKHLVSALEYFIKIAQGKYIPVTGMPYLNQGMVLGDENKITALWVNSPADKAQLEIGDHVWSINGGTHQTPSALEAQLQALPSGNQEIEVATPKDWDAAAVKESRLHSGKIKPNLLEFELVVP